MRALARRGGPRAPFFPVLQSHLCRALLQVQPLCDSSGPEAHEREAMTSHSLGAGMIRAATHVGTHEGYNIDCWDKKFDGTVV